MTLALLLHELLWLTSAVCRFWHVFKWAQETIYTMLAEKHATSLNDVNWGFDHMHLHEVYL